MYNVITLLCTWNFVSQLYINSTYIYTHTHIFIYLLIYLFSLYICKYKEKKIKCIDHIWTTVSTSCERQKETLQVLMLLKLLRKEHTSWHGCLENGDWRVEGVKIGAEKGFIGAPQFTSRLREVKRDFFSWLG